MLVKYHYPRLEFEDVEEVKLSTEEAAFLEKFAPFISGNNIREFMSTFDAAYFQIDRNANARILFTQLCFQTMRYIHQA
jgi:DNA polymerase-3 subunit delta'